MDNKWCLCSFLFVILLCFHFEVKFISSVVVDAASTGSNDEQRWPACIGPVSEPCSAFTNDEQRCPMTLNIGVPKKKGFTEFVNVCKDSATTECKRSEGRVTGFSIDVFSAALKLLRCKVDPNFLPFEKGDGESAGNYDQLLQNISVNKVDDFLDSFQQYDAVVGDVTILAKRASSVDFTVSYADSSVYVLVPTKHDARKNMWTFLKPLNWDLWLAILMAFFFVGIVIGTIEIRSNVTNIDFSGPPLQKLGMMIWYPVSMLVLPEKRMVVSMWSKLVLVVWLFVALIVMQSYTANLTTMLTIDQLRPFFDKEGNYSVGYQDGSFVKDRLIQHMNFTESRLKAYSTIEEYHEALSKGSDKGGVAAIYDELPYIKLFLQKYGSQYTVDGPIFRTNGFGFAFPRHSCLAPLISEAILNVTSGDEMIKIEKKYFKKEEISEVEISRLPQETPSLDAYNFTGLFIVMGSISIACLFCSEIWRNPSCNVFTEEEVVVVQEEEVVVVVHSS